MPNARIVAFRGRREGKDNRFAILDAHESGVEELVGAKVVWRTPKGRALHGRVQGPHGQKWFLARFGSGLPGEAIGGQVEIQGAGAVAPSPEKKRKK